MYLLYADETNPEPQSRGANFVLYGGLAIPTDAAPDLHRQISHIRCLHGFRPSDELKFSPAGRHHVDRDGYAAAKNETIRACRAAGAVFFAAACHHDIARRQEQKIQYQANSVLHSFQRFLERRRDVGIVQVDRLGRNGFAYLRERFQLGLNFPKGTVRLDRVLSFGMTCDGASHFASACDIALGALRHVVDHPERTDVNALMLPNVAALFWRDGAGVVTGRGLVLSPKDPSEVYRAEYTLFRSRLNQALARSVARRRKSLDWTQDTLAAAAGVSRQTVSHIENTVSNPFVGGLAVVADALTREEDRRRAQGRPSA